MNRAIRVMLAVGLAAAASGSALAGGAAPQLEIISLKPNKIVYDNGEAGTATVRLYNPSDAPVAVTLEPELVWDLEQAIALAPVSVTVPARGHAAAELSWPSPRDRWGHEIRVAAVVGGEALDTGRQFFGVNSEWMDLILISFARQAYKDNGLFQATEPFTSYSTVRHWFAWAPGDYAENAPEYDAWYSGQAGYYTTKQGIRDAIRECHEVGMHCTFYNNSFTSGKAGLEWARRHPEWICRERSGRPMLGGSPLVLTNDYTDKVTGKMGSAHMAFYDPKCIEYGAQNVIESVKMFGWDGMFWDCGGCALFPGFSYDGQPTPHGQNPDSLSARNFRMLHSMVREAYPEFGIWINGQINHFQQAFWSRFGNGGGLTTMEEQMSMPQTALLCEHRHHSQPGGRFHNWQYCLEQYATERDAVTQRLGAPIIAGYTTFTGWPAQSHLAAILLATQIRPANCHQEGSWPMTQFMTRYSSLLWREDVKVVANAESLLAVETDRPVWWRRLAYRRPSDEGEDIMLHLVTVPETENVDTSLTNNPPPVAGQVTLTIPAGRTVRKAFVLQPRIYRPGIDSKLGAGLDVGGMPARMARVPDPDSPGKTRWEHKAGSLCRGGPSHTEAQPVIVGGKATVSVPPFVYHAMVVFRLDG